MWQVTPLRGNDEQQRVVFSYSDVEQRIAADHRLRGIGEIADAGLGELDLHFAALYARRGRSSIPPERLIGALLLMVWYSISSERQLMEPLNYNWRYRWLVGLNMDEKVWEVWVFTKNRDRLMKGEVRERLLNAVLEPARAKHLLSAEHFTVEGTLIPAWASRQSFHAKDEPPSQGQGSGYKGQLLLRDPHQSKTDAEARLYKKSDANASLTSQEANEAKGLPPRESTRGSISFFTQFYLPIDGCKLVGNFPRRHLQFILSNRLNFRPWIP